MIGYIIRRIAYGFLILLGVNALTFALFFAVNTPDDMARLAIGGRYVTPEAIENWKIAHGYDLPLVYNEEAQGIEKITKTVFYTRSAPLLTGDLGLSDAGRSINREIAERVAVAGASRSHLCAGCFRDARFLSDGGTGAAHQTRVGGRGFCGHRDERLEPFLHHSRSVAVCKNIATGARFGLYGRLAHGSFFDPAGRNRHLLEIGKRHAFVPRHVS